jgi:hypothetical protein
MTAKVLNPPDVQECSIKDIYTPVSHVRAEVGDQVHRFVQLSTGAQKVKQCCQEHHLQCITTFLDCRGTRSTTKGQVDCNERDSTLHSTKATHYISKYRLLVPALIISIYECFISQPFTSMFYSSMWNIQFHISL